MIAEPIQQCNGYETVQDEIQLKWLSISYLPSDPRLSMRGKYQRCSCGENDLVCSLLCKCSKTKCQKRNHA